MFNNKKVLITGGASGIGMIMVEKLLWEGAEVCVWDYSESNLERLKYDLDVATMLVDISDSESVMRAADKYFEEIGDIDILINNAGIVVGGSFEENSIADIDKVMEVNVNGAMYVTRAFLPQMIAQGKGNICNIASSAGFISNPNMSVYVASKWAMMGWADSLRLEQEKNNTGVKVTTIMPYYINTGMFDGVKSRIPILDPEKVADIILKSIKKGSKQVPIYTWLYRLTRFAQAVFSVKIFDFLAGRVFGVYSTMDAFVGRKS